MTSNGIANPSNDVSHVVRNIPATDPAVYEHFKEKWNVFPANETEWIQRAFEVAGVLAADVVQRDRENKSPKAEIVLLKHSGLLKALGPKRFGGGEQPWSVGYKLIREVAKADGYDSGAIQVLQHGRSQFTDLLACF
jgi:hypothetical protein